MAAAKYGHAKSAPCISCKKQVKQTEKGLGCDFCNQWIHLTCSGITSKAYEVLEEEDIPWICKPCKATSKLLIAKMENLETNVKALQTELENAKNDINELKQQVRELKAQPQHKTFSSLFQEKDAPPVLNVATISKVIKHEQNSMASRKNNIVIKGLQKQGEELTPVKDLCESLQVDITGVEMTQRWINTKEDKPSKVIVKIGAEKRTELLRKAKQLRNLSRYKKVFINPDLTRAEEEANYYLRQKLKEERLARPNDDLVIRRGRIVPRYTYYDTSSNYDASNSGN